VCVDGPTSLVITGCLCVISASSVVCVLLLTYRTFAAKYVRGVGPVVVAAGTPTDVWNNSTGVSQTSSSTKRETELGSIGEDNDDVECAMLKTPAADRSTDSGIGK